MGQGVLCPIVNITEAIQGYIEALEEEGLPVSEERFETLIVNG